MYVVVCFAVLVDADAAQLVDADVAVLAVVDVAVWYVAAMFVEQLVDFVLVLLLRKKIRKEPHSRSGPPVMKITIA